MYGLLTATRTIDPPHAPLPLIAVVPISAVRDRTAGRCARARAALPYRRRRVKLAASYERPRQMATSSRPDGRAAYGAPEKYARPRESDRFPRARFVELHRNSFTW